jgi:hypothetical protein
VWMTSGLQGEELQLQEHMQRAPEGAGAGGHSSSHATAGIRPQHCMRPHQLSLTDVRYTCCSRSAYWMDSRLETLAMRRTSTTLQTQQATQAMRSLSQAAT